MNTEAQALASWFRRTAEARADSSRIVGPSDVRLAALMRDAADIADDLPADDVRIGRLVTAKRFSEFFGELVFLGGGTAVKRAKAESVARPGATGETVLDAVITAALRESPPIARPKRRLAVPGRSGDPA